MPATTTFSSDILQPANGTPPAGKGNVRLPALADWAKGTVLGFVTGTGAAVSEVQRITVTSTPSGTFRLSWSGGGLTYQTGAITYSGTAATMVANIQAAVDALFGTGLVTVSGTGPYDLTFGGDLANKSIPLPTIISSLTGGSLAVTEQAVGHPGSGLAVPYDDAASDGRQVARCVLIAPVKTDIYGQVQGNTPGSQKTSAEVYVSGTFYVSDLPSSGAGSLDAAAVVDLGRLINATSITATGAKLQVM
jgi:hypothetical protein